MLVYALLGGYDYEGQSLLGVYASREDAVAALEVFRAEAGGYGYDYYVLEPRVLGAPVNFEVESEVLE